MPSPVLQMLDVYLAVSIRNLTLKVIPEPKEDDCNVELGIAVVNSGGKRMNTAGEKSDVAVPKADFCCYSSAPLP